jgi:hypothetical protein
MIYFKIITLYCVGNKEGSSQKEFTGIHCPHTRKNHLLCLLLDYELYRIYNQHFLLQNHLKDILHVNVILINYICRKPKSDGFSNCVTLSDSLPEG